MQTLTIGTKTYEVQTEDMTGTKAVAYTLVGARGGRTTVIRNKKTPTLLFAQFKQEVVLVETASGLKVLE